MTGSVYVYLPLLAVAAVTAYTYKPHKSLPPGPSPLPFIGNLHQFPQQKPWVTFGEWKKKFGDIIYVQILGRPVVILTSREACTELLEKRSTIYSSRPDLAMFDQMVFDSSWDFGLMPYSNRWRQHRRLFHHYFSEKASEDYLDVQKQAAHALLRRLLHRPQMFLEHIRLSFSDAMLRVMYDVKVDGHDNKYVRAFERVLSLSNEAVKPGRTLMDLLPILKQGSTWLSGASSNKNEQVVKDLIHDMKELPAEHAMKKNREGHPTVFSKMLEKCQQDEKAKHLTEPPADIAKNTAAVAYTAGRDTTVSSIQAFFLAMANYPEVQRAAQAELDAVVGNDRLPTFEDMEHLPYICAIMKELLRWHTPVPSGVVHCSTEDDIYQDYFIPKGTLVMPIVWLMFHDPEVYPDPLTFNPSRWLINTPNGVELNDNVPSPDIAFGFGRRTCPGRYFARNGLFITISNVLACFNIAPLDDLGRPCEQLPEIFTEDLLMTPTPFRVSIKARTEKIPQLVENVRVQ